MGIPADDSAALRWFIETLSTLREQMSAEEFAALRMWIEFVADKQAASH